MDDERMPPGPEAIARLAKLLGVGILIDAIENPRPQDRRENVPVELVIRETTAAPPPRR